MTATGTQLADYLGRVAHSNISISRILALVLIAAIWLTVVVLVLCFAKGGKIKGFIKRAFRNVETEPQSVSDDWSSGYVFDVNNNEILNMDTNPTSDLATDVFVPKYNVEPAQNKKAAEPAEVYTPTPEDYGIGSEPNVVSDSNNGGVVSKESVVANGGGKKTDKSDLTTEINAFVNLIVRGDDKPVLEFVRKIKDKNISVDEFATDAVLELDVAYRARIGGETNRRNVVLSQIVSHWSNSKMEAVISALLSIVEGNYSDKNLGMKIALMRIMRA
jgi:hypothetical protein